MTYPRNSSWVQPPPFQIESIPVAMKRHKVLVARLGNSDDARAAALRERLEGCAKGARCASAACPICLRRFRLRLMKVAIAPIHQSPCTRAPNKMELNNAVH